MDSTENLQQFAEKRIFKRLFLTGNFPGILTDENRTELEVLCLDISKSGLGLLLTPGPKVNTIIIFRRDEIDLTLRFEVRWSRPAEQLTGLPGMERLHRVGLLSLDDTIDLFELFKSLPEVQIEE